MANATLTTKTTAARPKQNNDVDSLFSDNNSVRPAFSAYPVRPQSRPMATAPKEASFEDLFSQPTNTAPSRPPEVRSQPPAANNDSTHTNNTI